ncbi:amino acid permease (plasmid) [Methylosinus sp. C49]|uniref:APC family permease n=1 Tax=Methylosinus sp. C49 TaxID=2699395 RepID=UPI00136758B8|nr:amino acid permease [Methylosinus sp. C49]BBU64214.1 amino acid permease [Methylosinus sp. C49]
MGASFEPAADGHASGGERGPRKGKLLGFSGAVALVIANTIGTGVFTTSGFALADLGEPGFVMLSWLIGGLYALAGVVIYSDLAAEFPESGGEYVFLRNTLHPALGSVAGWISLVAGFTTPIAVAALGAQLYLARAGGPGAAAPWVATLIVIGLGLLHAGAPAKGVAFQNLAVLIKICAIVAFIAFGAPVAGAAFAAAPPPSLESFPLLAFAGSLVWISYAYSGWNAAVYVTGDIDGGGRTVERALYSGTLLVIALYLGVSAVILYGAPPEQIRGVAESGALAALAIGGPRAEQALSALIALALVTSASSMLLSGPRVYARMASDGVLPAAFGRLDGDYPRFAILAQATFSLIVIWSGGLRDLLEFAGVTLSLSAGAVVVGWLRQQMRRILARDKLLEICAAVVFLSTTAGIMISALIMRPASAIAAALLIGVGLLAYALGRPRANSVNRRV